MKFGNIVSMIIILVTLEEFILAADFTVAVLQGEQALLPCILPPDLDDNVTVTWSFWDQKISDGDNVTIEDQRFTLYRPYQSDWYLRISSTQIKDRGRYRCVVEDSEFSSVATLVVESPPSVKGYNSDEVFIQICYKTQLTLYCNVTGLPRPIITWYKLNNRNQPVPILSEQEIYEQRIFVPEIDETSAGVFMCKVKNTHGEASMKFHVKVLDLMTIIEPVRKSEMPRQIVHTRVLTSSNGQECIHVEVQHVILHSLLLTFLHILFVRTEP